MAQKDTKQENTIQRKGGAATLKKHGKSHYRKMAEARWGKKKKK